MSATCPCCGGPMTRVDPRDLTPFLKLTHFERRIYECLARRFGAAVETETLIDAAYGDRIDGGPEFARTCISRSLQSIRRALAPHGLTVEWRNGRGGWRRLTWTDRVSP